VHWNVRQHLTYDGFASVHCIPDFLGAIGYKMFAYCSGACDIMKMKHYMIERRFQSQDSAEHHKQNDDQLFTLLQNDVLPSLASKKSQPFALLIVNADTHPDFTIGAMCNDYLSIEHYPKVYRSFTCFDQHLERFMAKLSELGLDKNTEVVVYGDHLTMFAREYRLGADRNLTIFLPLRPQDEKWRKAQEEKTMSYYDFAPTVMELLEIDYSPPFPFGKDLLGTEPGGLPTVDDMKVIYGLATGDLTNETARCRGEIGFCLADEDLVLATEDQSSQVV
jgi:phosphoglycerol transferase MdoB-like AlkP superfamily enzyme